MVKIDQETGFLKRLQTSLPVIIAGLDFTSSPRKQKKLHLVRSTFCGSHLVFHDEVEEWDSFKPFDTYLASALSQPTLLAIDAPMGLPRELISELELPLTSWHDYVHKLCTGSRDGFVDGITKIRNSRPPGEKYLYRANDKTARSSSPMKLVNPPVALMFFECVRRIVDSRFVPIWCDTHQSHQIVAEAYPALFARLAKAGPYKSESQSKETTLKFKSRQKILDYIIDSKKQTTFPFTVTLSDKLIRKSVEDIKGDILDSILCVIHGAYYAAALKKEGVISCDALEGTILIPE